MALLMAAERVHEREEKSSERVPRIPSTSVLSRMSVKSVREDVDEACTDVDRD